MKKDKSKDSKPYTKVIRADGNTEYTITSCKSFFMETVFCFTKILVSPENEILAYIDVQKLPRQSFESQFKGWKWFGIQEFHPELIGDFTVTANREDDTLTGYLWKHDTTNHLYTLISSGLRQRKDWYKVKTHPLVEGTIETNFNILCEDDTRSYRYNTHPTEPTERIEKITKLILMNEGVIKPELTARIQQIVQRVL